MNEQKISQDAMYSGARNYADALRNKENPNAVQELIETARYYKPEARNARDLQRADQIKAMFTEARVAHLDQAQLEIDAAEFAEIMAVGFLDDPDATGLDKQHVIDLFKQAAVQHARITQDHEYQADSGEMIKSFQLKDEFHTKENAKIAGEQHSGYIAQPLSERTDVPYTDLCQYFIDHNTLELKAGETGEQGLQRVAKDINEHFKLQPEKQVTVEMFTEAFDEYASGWVVIKDRNEQTFMIANLTALQLGPATLELGQMLNYSPQEVLNELLASKEQVIANMADNNTDKRQKLLTKSTAYLAKMLWQISNNQKNRIRNKPGVYASERNPLITTYPDMIKAITAEKGEAIAKDEIIKDPRQAATYISQRLRTGTLNLDTQVSTQPVGFVTQVA